MDLLSLRTKIFISLYEIYTSTSFLLISMILGILYSFLGVYYLDLFYKIGYIYLRMMEFVVIPIIIFSLSIGVFRIISSPFNISFKIIKLSLFYIIFSLLLSTFILYIIKPWEFIGKDFYSFIMSNNSYIQDDLVSYYESFSNKAVSIDFFSILNEFFPYNIFTSFSLSNNFQIILLTIIISFAIYSSLQNLKDRDKVIKKFEIALDVFSDLNDKILYFLPIGVFFMMVYSFKESNLEIIKSVSYISFSIISFFIINSIFCLIIVKIKSKKSFNEFFYHMKDSIKIIISSRSSAISLPSVMKSMNNLGFDDNIIKLHLPIFLPLYQASTISFFAMFSIFAAKLFDIEVDFIMIFLISLLAILATFSGIGSPDIIALQKISLILTPLSIPYDTIFPLFLSTFVICDIFETFSNICSNLLISALCHEK